MAHRRPMRQFSALNNPLGSVPVPEPENSLGALAGRCATAHGGASESGPAVPRRPDSRFQFPSLGRGGHRHLARRGSTPSRGSTGYQTIAFADGSSIRLDGLSRRTALELVAVHSRESRDAQVAFGSTKSQEEAYRTQAFVAQSVARLDSSSLVSPSSGATIINFTQTINVGEVNVDSRKVEGDVITVGDTTNSTVNIKSKLENVHQSINQASGFNDETKKELDRLIEELTKELGKCPDDQKEDAEAVAELAGDFVEDATKDQPNKRALEISAEGLTVRRRPRTSHPWCRSSRESWRRSFVPWPSYSRRGRGTWP